MSVFKVQRIRSCIQCGDVLSQKCGACVKHPDRVPRVVEYHNWPPILKVAECGCCVQVACQNPTCSVKVWRTKKQSATGLSRSATLFCSKRCNAVTQNAARDTRVLVPCGWHECRKKIPRRASLLRTFKNAYCRPDHYYLAEAKKRHDAKEAARQTLDGGDVQTLACYGACKGALTDHKRLPNGQYQCPGCGRSIDEPSVRHESHSAHSRASLVAAKGSL